MLKGSTAGILLQWELLLEFKNHIKLTDILYIIEDNMNYYVNVIRIMTLMGQNNVYDDLKNIKIHFFCLKWS